MVALLSYLKHKSTEKMKLAVIGATGMVGTEMLSVIAERKLSYSKLILAASEESKGKKIQFNGEEIEVCTIAEALEAKPDIALFSAGGTTSLEWAPKFAAQKTRVIDNSSAWRMDPNKKLVVPEINASALTDSDYIIANPNCSTIQLVMVLKPLHDAYKIKRVIVSTYQSITGTGMKAMEQLENERSGKNGPMAYPYKIDQNCIPHCDDFLDNGYTKEEMKLTNETKKILDDASIHVTATAVRVPVLGGHSESVNIEFEKEFNTTEIKKLLSQQSGISVQDNTDVNQYPMPLYSRGKDDVFVGRIRRDLSQANSLNLWIVSDNLRKGAATNAVQIAEAILSK